MAFSFFRDKDEQNIYKEKYKRKRRAFKKEKKEKTDTHTQLYNIKEQWKLEKSRYIYIPRGKKEATDALNKP